MLFLNRCRFCELPEGETTPQISYDHGRMVTYAYCPKCLARGPAVDHLEEPDVKDKKEEAAKRWNTIHHKRSASGNSDIPVVKGSHKQDMRDTCNLPPPATPPTHIKSPYRFNFSNPYSLDDD